MESQEYNLMPRPSRQGRLAFISGEGALPRAMSMAAAALARGELVLLLDGGNCFDVYPIARAARMHGLAPEPMLKRLFVSRAFTCHQMSALIREKLGPELRRLGAQKVVILGLLYTFCDEDVPEREAHTLLKKTMESLQGISQGGCSILVAEPSLQRPALRMRKLITRIPFTLPSPPHPTLSPRGEEILLWPPHPTLSRKGRG